MLANGMLAGLVAITAPCAFVTAPVAAHRRVAECSVGFAVVYIERTCASMIRLVRYSVHFVNGVGACSLSVCSPRNLRRRV